MNRRVIVALCAIWSLLFAPIVLAPISAFAQGIDLETPPPERQREPSVGPRGDERIQPRQPERDINGFRTPVPHAPTFLPLLSKQTRTGRAGVAGWTAPNTPGGSRAAGDPDNAGWLGLGLAIEWGRSPGAAGTN